MGARLRRGLHPAEAFAVGETDPGQFEGPAVGAGYGERLLEQVERFMVYGRDGRRRLHEQGEPWRDRGDAGLMCRRRMGRCLRGTARSDRRLDEIHDDEQRRRDVRGEFPRAADGARVPVRVLEAALAERGERPRVRGARQVGADPARCRPQGHLVRQGTGGGLVAAGRGDQRALVQELSRQQLVAVGLAQVPALRGLRLQLVPLARREMVPAQIHQPLDLHGERAVVPPVAQHAPQRRPARRQPVDVEGGHGEPDDPDRIGLPVERGDGLVEPPERGRCRARRVGHRAEGQGELLRDLRFQQAERAVQRLPQLRALTAPAQPGEGVQRVDHGGIGGVVRLVLHVDRADEQPVRGVEVALAAEEDVVGRRDGRDGLGADRRAQLPGILVGFAGLPMRAAVGGRWYLDHGHSGTGSDDPPWCA
ncbi:hypothetical protein [Streptomyces sp. MBT65]|uniref:hypothetical protein n=1 Tax=Streptomyces sp. MBT65 TaxID=1488395 RepID=UPI0027DA2720|nr:hypothetical protein [Streptomyces sp. MBT65]